MEKYFCIFQKMKKAISPLDGRYENSLNPLRDFFSEESLIFFRVVVEIKWLVFLSDRADISLRTFSAAEKKILQKILDDFSEKDAARVKKIEKTTNHDVKAVEYFLKEKIENTSLKAVSEWIHFALTSEDVNNLAYCLMIKKSVQKVLLPALKNLETAFFDRAKKWKTVSMLARTHGQPASPTTMGKEFLIFARRISRQNDFLKSQTFFGKIAGASGNFNAHLVAFPDADWLDISEKFVKTLKLEWNPVVPQIEPHDFLGEISHLFSRLSTIFIDAARDIWGYISLGFFRQKAVAGEVGSSAMPHKINPIDFENAEGNFGIAISLFSHFAAKLPISRWQRDLTDSTVLRNFGVAFGHFFLALKSFEKGLSKLEICPEKMAADLQQNPEILAEAAQTAMRAENIKNPYEKLKNLSRGKKMDLKIFREFVKNSELSAAAKKRLLDLTPEKYIGLAAEICEKFVK